MTEAVEARTVVAEDRYTPNRLVPVLGEKWIPRDRKCVASSRRFVHDVATDWDAAEDVPEVAELLVSELVTNALTHGAASVPTTSTIRIKVSRENELIVVDVHDSCTAVPRLRRACHLDLRGRGLAIVQTFSHQWGWTLTRTASPSGSSSSPGPLPLRSACHMGWTSDASSPVDHDDSAVIRAI